MGGGLEDNRNRFMQGRGTEKIIVLRRRQEEIFLKSELHFRA